MKRCAQKLDITDPMVMASQCSQMVLQPEHYLCAYHRKLALGQLSPAHIGAYGLAKTTKATV